MIDPSDSRSQPKPDIPDAEKTEGLDTAIHHYEQNRERRETLRLEGSTRSSKVRRLSEKMLTRTLSGILYSIVVIICLFWGAIPTALLFSAMAWLCCSEFFRMSRMMGRMPNELIGLAAAVAFALSPLFPPLTLTAIFSVLVLATGVWYVWTARASVSDAAVTVFAPIYTGYLLSAVTSIRLMHGSATYFGVSAEAVLCFGVIASIWMNDAVAYLVGSRWGSHRMAPKISPHKTWEGFAGGIVGSIGVWLLMYAIHLPGVSLPIALLGGVGVGTIGVIGDLFESRLKRSAGVKDSGNFIPGHGGMLDRTDSILFGVMTAYFILRLGGLA